MENTRPRLNTTRLRRRHVNAGEDSSFMHKTLRQLLVCGIIAAAVFAVAKIDAPTCKVITNSIRNTLIYTVDYKTATISLLENVKKLPKMFSKEEEASEVSIEENADAQSN